MAVSTRALLAGAVFGTTFLISADPVGASTWAPSLKAGSAGEAKAQTAPTAPTGVSAACVSSSGKEVTVTWSAVAHASSYTVYDSTSSSSSGYAAATTGITGSSWTSGTLSSTSYWFEVAVYVGTKWVSASGEITIAGSGTECTHP